MKGDALRDSFGDIGMTKAAANKGLLACVLALFAALALAFALSFAAPVSAFGADVDPETQEALEQLKDAFADAYAEAQEDVAADEVSSLGEAIEDDGTPLAAAPDADAAVEEEILDEENPLAASPYAASVHGFAGVLLGIAAVATLFFLVLTNRLNRNIDQMRRFVD